MGALIEAIYKPPTRAKRLYTGEDLLRHPEWGPCELIRGKVVPVCRPNFEHGELMNEIGTTLRIFCKKGSLGSVVTGDSGVYLERNPDTLRGPDVFFISKARRPDKEARKGFLEIPPELCVEIVSPKDRWSKLLEKVNLYLAIGVKRVWVIDPQTRTALVYRGGDNVTYLNGDGILSGEDILPGFELPLKELFAILD